MSTTAPTDPQIPSSNVPAAPSFEETLRIFWEKNAKLIYLLCALVLLAVIGKGAFEYSQAQKENGIAKDYGQATTSEKLKSFAAANPDHALSGAAHLRLADEAIEAGKFAEAAASYQKAAAIFKTGPLAGRASLGAAIADVAAGQSSKGEEHLKRLSEDATQLKTVRAEAAYHLGTLYADAGRTDDAVKYLDQVGAIDPASMWAQRSAFRRASLPTAASSVLVPSLKP